MAHRVQFIMSDEAYEELERLAARRKGNVSEVIRDSIALEKWLDENQQTGAKVLIEREGDIREIHLMR